MSAIADYLKPYKTIALVLQGGGALGAYQAGVFQALAEADIAPLWLSGVSIGAVNAAIIAGNAPAQQVQRLRDFWETVSASSVWDGLLSTDALRSAHNQSTSFMTMATGLPGFFKPKIPSLFDFNPFAPFAAVQDSTSYYETDELKDTLNSLIDWKLLNNQRKRLSVGAVDVQTGNSIYFDTKHQKLDANHIMASGALPPALPAIKIGKKHYWDGGLVSNTPLQYLLEQQDISDTLAFQVDLFSARGELPSNMAEVMGRQKDITYSSRTRSSTDAFMRSHELRLKLRDALSRIKISELTPDDHKLMASMENTPQINLIHLIYQQKIYEGQAKDYSFSKNAMTDHWDAGLADTRKTLKHPAWLEIPSETAGMVVNDIHRDELPK